ncbi:MAG: mandelate racemase, partial [Bradymonadaceae bacterium]
MGETALNFGAGVPVTDVEAAAYEIPTDQQPESDGTLQWSSTTLVVVELEAGGETGVGYTYNHRAAATIVRSKLAEALEGENALAIRERWRAMQRIVRNLGRVGVVASAIAAADAALWDLKGKLLEAPVADLLGRARDAVPVYGSGGFTSY